jgi:hypothetical protein
VTSTLLVLKHYSFVLLRISILKLFLFWEIEFMLNISNNNDLEYEDKLNIIKYQIWVNNCKSCKSANYWFCSNIEPFPLNSTFQTSFPCLGLPKLKFELVSSQLNHFSVFFFTELLVRPLWVLAAPLNYFLVLSAESAPTITVFKILGLLWIILLFLAV